MLSLGKSHPKTKVPTNFLLTSSYLLSDSLGILGVEVQLQFDQLQQHRPPMYRRREADRTIQAGHEDGVRSKGKSSSTSKATGTVNWQ